MYPTIKEENKLQKRGYRIIAGLDEVGRGGPLAGPVVAVAVFVNLKRKFEIKKLFKEVRDSKKLSVKKREWLYKVLVEHPQIEWGIGRVSPRVIDRINIKNAAELAMERAVLNLEKKIKEKINFLIIDGNNLKNRKLKKYNLKLITKADEKVFSCAVASIIAKVKRDKMMLNYHRKYPNYGFAQHKGYSTKLHRKLLKKYGPSVIHRQSFSFTEEIVK